MLSFLKSWDKKGLCTLEKEGGERASLSDTNAKMSKGEERQSEDISGSV